jgi:hypothetical protein
VRDDEPLPEDVRALEPAKRIRAVGRAQSFQLS